jgi:23S rRNA (pseudouridine1915-N3)-methyltransferase
MAEIKIISVGTLKEGYLKEAVAEYKKRLSQYARVDEINIKEELIRDEDNHREIEKALTAEGERIIAAIPEGAMKIALCVEGKQYSSEALASLIGEGVNRSGKIALVIGSSHGLSDAVKRACEIRLSVSAMTFPHQLMRVILLEALYRSFTIIAGKRYHK